MFRPYPPAPEMTSTIRMSHMLARRTRQMSEPESWMPGCACPMAAAGRASGVWPTGRGSRIGVVVGSVVIGSVLLLSLSGCRARSVLQNEVLAEPGGANAADAHYAPEEAKL